jgi:DNA processing protein
MPPGNVADWVALNLLPGLGPLSHRRALDRFGDPGGIAYRLSPAGFRSLPGIGPDRCAAIVAAREELRRRVDDELLRCRRMGIRLVPLVDPAYPAAFEGMPDAPILLYVRGELGEGIVRVAVVGSRRATAYGRRTAIGLASALAARGVDVVSGGARGIDTHAHRGALEAGGRTVAVLGSGFLSPYPRENEPLFDRIAGSGAVISEFPLDLPPAPGHFPRRNRLVSGLSSAVVVVEGTRRSGSMITAAHALEQGREVMAVPGPVSSDRSEGCHRLIQQGAKLVHETQDIFDELSPMYASALGPPVRRRPGDPAPAGEPPGLTEDEAEILRLLDDPEPVHVDQLAERAPFGVARLQTALFGLELRSLVEQLPGRYYLCRPREPEHR